MEKIISYLNTVYKDLDELTKRLQDASEPFEIYEEDTIILNNLLDMLDELKGGE